MTKSKTYRRVEKVMMNSFGVGSGQIFDLSDLDVAPDGRRLAASGLLMDRLEGVPEQRICLVDLESGELQQVTEGPHRDRLPCWDNAGERLAYLSDAEKAYDFQLRILTLATGKRADVTLPGRWVESLQWSPTGAQILLVAAGQGADLAGVQGAVSAPAGQAEGPAWTPHIDVGVADSQWRTVWVYDLKSGECRQVSPVGMNVWEACWCGASNIVCIASDSPEEEAWYSADVRLFQVGGGNITTIYHSSDQLGCISASPSGERIAFVEAPCSDRMLVAGTMMVGGREGFVSAGTGAVDVTFATWQGEDDILFAGLRGFETVLSLFSMSSRHASEIWVSSSKTLGGPLFPEVAPSNIPGSVVFMEEGHLSRPALVQLSMGASAKSVLGIHPVPVEKAHSGVRVEQFEWTASDGLGIQGWLLLPEGEGPHPLVMEVHGGPVWRTRPRYVGRGGATGMLLRSGYAIFQPNPRGSSGQGQDYARRVFGDVGGADAADLLSGLDKLVERGIADPSRIGVIGGSYGGYMTAWLITQDQRFAAAVPIAPVTDWISGRLTSHVSFSIEMFLGGKDFGPESLYLARSPITYAEKVKTPTMIICGELDRSTPPSQAVEFHHALTLSGGTSVLVTYPGEGHGVRQFPAVIDFVSRILDWFGHHMPIDGLNGGVLPERAEMGSTSNVSTNVETSPVG